MIVFTVLGIVMLKCICSTVCVCVWPMHDMYTAELLSIDTLHVMDTLAAWPMSWSIGIVRLLGGALECSWMFPNRSLRSRRAAWARIEREAEHINLSANSVCDT